MVQENGKLASAISVYSLPIVNLATDRIYLLWGIQSTYSDSNLNAIPLFKAESSSPSIIPYNSYNIGFSFLSTSPI